MHGPPRPSSEHPFFLEMENPAAAAPGGPGFRFHFGRRWVGTTTVNTGTGWWEAARVGFRLAFHKRQPRKRVLGAPSVLESSHSPFHRISPFPEEETAIQKVSVRSLESPVMKWRSRGTCVCNR